MAEHNKVSHVIAYDPHAPDAQDKEECFVKFVHDLLAAVRGGLIEGFRVEVHSTKAPAATDKPTPRGYR